MKKLSIITINYNNVDGLKKTIDSVLTQTWQDFEWIIIDGGSSDGSKDLIEQTSQFCDKISFWCSEPDKGIYNAMNKGIKKSCGEYLNFMNSGDCFYSKYSLRDIFALEYEEDILVGNALVSLNNKEYKFNDVSHCVYNFSFFFHTSFPHQAMFFKKKVFDKYGLYDENYKIVSDWKYTLETIYLNQVPVKYIPVKVCLYEGNGISTTNYVFKERIDVLNSYFPKILMDDIEYLESHKRRYDVICNNVITKNLYILLFNMARTLNFCLRRIKKIV